MLAGMTLIEPKIVTDPVVRAACADEQLAIVFLKCGLKATDLPKVLDDLAKVSGYNELATAHIIIHRPFRGRAAGSRLRGDV